MHGFKTDRVQGHKQAGRNRFFQYKTRHELDQVQGGWVHSESSSSMTKFTLNLTR